jgi:hypothetical protein
LDPSLTSPADGRPRCAPTRTPDDLPLGEFNSHALAGLDINDAGQMHSGDDIDFNADIQLTTRAAPCARYFQFGTSTRAGWNLAAFRSIGALPSRVRCRFTTSGA